MGKNVQGTSMRSFQNSGTSKGKFKVGKVFPWMQHFCGFTLCCFAARKAPEVTYTNNPITPNNENTPL